MSFSLPFPFLFLLVCSISYLADQCVAEIECLPEQRASLLELKKGFSFPFNDSLPSWEPGSNCCNWPEVTCDSESGRVIGLHLSGHDVSGNISSSLLNLTSLQTLNLAYNRFHGIAIPEYLETLTNLTRLNLSHAGFAGKIPIAISRLTRLFSLDLSNDAYYLDDFEGDTFSLQLNPHGLPTLVRNLTNLRELCLDNIDISNDVNWSTTLSTTLPRLRILSLVGCDLQGIVTKDIFQLKDLVSLDLSQNPMLSGILPKFLQGNTVEKLVLSYTNISGKLPDSIGSLTKMTSLHIRQTGMRGALPSSIGNLTKLVYLDLSSNYFDGELPFSVGRLARLEYLDLSWNNFGGVISASVSNLSSLELLNLRQNSFSGVVPSLAKLGQLFSVDLSNNHLSGSLPSFSPLARIGSLVLSNNSFRGPVPSSYSAFCCIKSLDLSFNSISGQIPAYLFSFPDLLGLNLGHNQLSGDLKEFRNISTSLDSIDLSYNQLQGPVPASLFELSQLQLLNLASNNLSVQLGMFKSLQNLTELDLSNNQVLFCDHGCHYPHFLPKLNSLRLSSCNLTKLPALLRYQDAVLSLNDLDMSNNRISGGIPNWIWGVGNGSLTSLNLSLNLFTHVEGLTNLSFGNLMYLDLHSNMLQGPIPLPSVRSALFYLDYSHNKFSSIIPSNLFDYFPWLESFSLANNQFTGNIPKIFCNIASFQEVLDLSNNNLSGLIPQCLFEVNYPVLNLRGNQLQGAIPQNINERCRLETILLSDNQLEGTLPRSLLNCKNLLVFDAANNNITGSFPFWLGTLINLKALILRNNGFYGHIGTPKEDELNCTFAKLQILDFSFNHFNGYLPSKFLGNLKVMMNSSGLKYSTAGLSYNNDSTTYQDPIAVTSKGQTSTLVYQLTILVSLDISNNEFEGDIPEAIGKLRGLQVLNFSCNGFTGKIPSSIGNLKQLESLDLSANHLSGEIPQEMTSLTFLAYLKLADNELAGRIPQGNQFSTFPNSSFAGNQGLCGRPLLKQCGETSLNKTDTVLPSSFEDSTYVIGLALSVGLGFGIGLAGVLVLQNVRWKFWKKRNSHSQRVRQRP